MSYSFSLNDWLSSIQASLARPPRRKAARQTGCAPAVETLEQRTLLSVDAILLSLEREYSSDDHPIEFCPEPDVILAAEEASTPPAEAPTFPLEDTFHLHSHPGATKRIFLDFDGHTTTGTYWNSSFTAGAPINTPAFSQDSNPAFSDAELLAIQETFHRVSEDFIGFDVDVTTEDPGTAALVNSGGSDSEWGIRVLIGGSASDWYGSGAGGVAYIGSFTWNSDTPTFVFSKNLANTAKYIAEAVSHEVGHTLGLRHDGRTSPSESYYAGHGSGETSWAPIMGVGYYKNVTQWSKGEYSNANNLENDLAIITTYNGFGYRTDDVPGAYMELVLSNGAASFDGILERGDDESDRFLFSTSGGTVSIDLTPFHVGTGHAGANNDLAFSLFDESDGSLVAIVNPASTLDAHLQLALAAGTYSVLVYCDDNGSPSTGYSDYASMGRYTLNVAAPQADLNVEGNGLAIHDGDAVPDATDGTDFGSISLANGPVTRTFVITNNGPTARELTGNPRIEIMGLHAADFTVTSQPASTIGPGQTTSFTVAFLPSATGLRTATVSIAYDQGVYDFAIQGTGLGAPNINVHGNGLVVAAGDHNPSTADGTDFGSLNWNRGTVKKYFTLANTGSIPLQLTGSPRVQISGPHAGDFKVSSQPRSSLAPGRTKTFKIKFNPSAEGLRTATVRIFSDDADASVYEFTIQGWGVTPAPEIDVRAGDASIAAGSTDANHADGTDFGNVNFGSSSVTRVFTIANVGTASLHLTSQPRVQITGANASDFRVSKQPSRSVSAGREKSFKIDFEPTALGLRTATVRIFSDDSDESLYEFTIQGTGSAPGMGGLLEAIDAVALVPDQPTAPITPAEMPAFEPQRLAFEPASQGSTGENSEPQVQAEPELPMANFETFAAASLDGFDAPLNDPPAADEQFDSLAPSQLKPEDEPDLESVFASPLALSTLFETL